MIFFCTRLFHQPGVAAVFFAGTGEDEGDAEGAGEGGRNR